MSDMATLVTRTAQEQICALNEDERDAVDAVIESTGLDNGELIELPSGEEGKVYRAVRTRGESTPVIIYREDRGSWLILSLMTPQEYEDMIKVRDNGWRPALSPEVLAAARPFGDIIYARLLDLAKANVKDPTGNEVFPHSPEDAQTWDRVAKLMTTAERVWLIAGLQALEARAESNQRSDTESATA
jgi:hypothetical protein